MMARNFLKHHYSLFPLYGMLAFLLIHSAATSYYPGGSINMPKASSYSFFHNYLCDAMNTQTPGGQINSGSSLGMLSHLVLSGTMVSFFFILPEIFSSRNRNTATIRAMGMLTMTFFALMFTKYHDLMIFFTAIFGTIALIPLFIELHRHNLKTMRHMAYFCYLMSLLVFLLFITDSATYYLPFFQKVVFLIDASWVVWVSFLVYRKGRGNN